MIYQSCRDCNGRGSIKCSKCVCASCRGTGKATVVCGQCGGNKRLKCHACAGSRRVLLKKSWFSEKYGDCTQCRGAGAILCKACNEGEVSVACSACEGSGASVSCSNCGGRGSVPCKSCGASGQVAPNWSRDRVLQEIAQREASIREMQEAVDYWYEEYEQKPYLYEDGFPARDLESAIVRLR